MIDRRHIQLLKRQRYVVVRPTGEVVSFYKQLQKELLSLLSSSISVVSYPGYPHVTIRGFPEGTDLDSLRRIIGEWVETVSPLDIRIGGLSYFPDPYKVVFVEIAKNEALVDAFNRLSLATAELPQFEPQRS